MLRVNRRVVSDHFDYVFVCVRALDNLNKENKKTIDKQIGPMFDKQSLSSVN